MARHQLNELTVCIGNGNRAALEKLKIYVALHDLFAEMHGLIRVIDGAGDSYLYPKTFFRSILLPFSVKWALLAAA